MIIPKPQSGHFGGELPFVCLGDGPSALVIFPALGDAVRDVTDLAWRLAWYYRSFADDHKVYLVSRKRGLPAGYTTRQMAADYAEAFERSIGGPADVVGLSMGGLIAQHFAADFPQHVRRLIIGVAAHRLGAEGERLVRRWSTLAQEQVADLTTSSLRHSASSSVSRTILLAGDAEVREEYMAIDPYTRP